VRPDLQTSKRSSSTHWLCSS